MSRHFSKDDMQTANWQSPRCSTSLGTGKWLAMMMMIMMMILQKVTSVEEDVEKSEPSYTVGGNVKWYSCFGK